MHIIAMQYVGRRLDGYEPDRAERVGARRERVASRPRVEQRAGVGGPLVDRQQGQRHPDPGERPPEGLPPSGARPDSSTVCQPTTPLATSSSPAGHEQQPGDQRPGVGKAVRAAIAATAGSANATRPAEASGRRRSSRCSPAIQRDRRGGDQDRPGRVARVGRGRHQEQQSEHVKFSRSGVARPTAATAAGPPPGRAPGFQASVAPTATASAAAGPSTSASRATVLGSRRTWPPKRAPPPIVAPAVAHRA
jgi:hypothetical protein